MPRSEQPLEGDDALTAFAADLRTLRQKAGSPPYRRLARVAHYSSTTLADAAGGKRLPSLAVTLAYVRACGGDAEGWETRWHQVAAALAHERRGSDPDADTIEDGRCPYAGLSAFESGDASRFFGRERLTDELVERVRSRRFVALFGASGSGKSSLLRAGLLPRIAADVAPAAQRAEAGHSWPVLSFTPGPHPLDECAARLSVLVGGSAVVLHRQLREDPRALHLAALQALAARPAGTDLLVVVDQFEEVFTLCAERERERFLELLLTAAAEPNSRVRVVVGMRADFYHRCAQYPALVEALRDAQVLVGPMSTDELRRAISGPAATADCAVEGALLARIVADAAGQPNALPLVSHALRETWRHRRGNTLTVAGYEAAGGIRHALARTAEATYQALSEEHRRLAREILLRLVNPGEGTQDTKRPVARGEIDSPQADEVLDTLARARLLSLDAETIELTHEALLDAWPRLRRWIDEDRAGLLIRQQLTAAAAAWQRERHDTAALYRGERLAAATAWVKGRRALPLDERSRQFLAASARHARRTAFLRRGAIASLCALALAAGGTAMVAVRNADAAQRGEQQARAQHALGLSRQLAAQSRIVDQTEPVLARQLALAALQVAPTDEAKASMLDLLTEQQRSILVPASGSPVTAVAFSADGKLIAVASQGVMKTPDGRRDGSGVVQLFDSATGLSLAPPVGLHYGWASALGFSSDGKRLFISFRSGLLVWDVTTHGFVNTAMTRPSTPDGFLIASTALSPGNRFALTAGANELQIWNTSTDSPIGPPVPWQGTGDRIFAVSPDGEHVAGSTDDGSVRLLEVRTGRTVEVANPEATNVRFTQLLTFSSDGKILAAVDPGRGSMLLWDVAAGQPLQRGFTRLQFQDSPAFSPDGSMVATAAAGAGFNRDATVQVWNTSTGLAVGHPMKMNSPSAAASPTFPLALSPDGALLAVGSRDGTVRLWNPTAGAPPGVNIAASQDGQAVSTLAYSPDGALLAAGRDDGSEQAFSTTTGRVQTSDPGVLERQSRVESSVFTHESLLTVVDTGGYAGKLSLRAWNPNTGSVKTTGLLGESDVNGPIAFSANGKYLATSVERGRKVQIWDTKMAQQIGASIPVPSSVDSLAFSCDGRLLATGSDDGTILLWDPLTGRSIGKPMVNPEEKQPVSSIAFSPDAKHLAVGDNHSRVQLWDPTRQQRITSAPIIVVGAYGIYQMTYSPDGTLLAVGADDGTVRLWNGATGQQIATLTTADSQPVRALAFSVNGALLAAAKDNSDVQQWEAAMFANPVATLCGEVQPISDWVWSQYAAGEPKPRGCP